MAIVLKVISVWMLIALAEMVHGILRAKLVAPQIGDLRSRQVGVFTGSILFSIIIWYCFDFLGIDSERMAILVGLSLMSMMVLFDVLVGHYIFHFTWKWIAQDFNILKGRILAVGMIALALCPWIIFKIRSH